MEKSKLLSHHIKELEEKRNNLKEEINKISSSIRDAYDKLYKEETDEYIKSLQGKYVKIKSGNITCFIKVSKVKRNTDGQEIYLVLYGDSIKIWFDDNDIEQVTFSVNNFEEYYPFDEKPEVITKEEFDKYKQKALDFIAQNFK